MLIECDFPPDIRVEKEINTLYKGGYEIHVLSFSYNNRPKKEITEKYTVYRKEISTLRKKTSVGCLLFPFYFNFWSSFIEQVSKTNSFDAIHVHDLPLAKVGKKWANKLNIPFVLDLHENWPAMLRTAIHTNTPLGKMLSWNWLWDKYEAEMVSKADAVITVVEEMKNRVSHSFNDKDKFSVYQNVPEFTEDDHLYKNPKNDLNLIYLGGLDIERGLQTVIEAISIIPKEENITLTIIGFGTYLNELKQLTLDLEIEDRITFLGKLPQEEALQKIKEYHIAIVPHHRSVQSDNSSPNKLFQYMMKKLPIICSDCSSLVRVIKDSNCGYIYESRSVIELVELLKKINSNKVLLATYSKNAYHAASSKYNSEIESKHLLAAYEKLKI